MFDVFNWLKSVSLGENAIFKACVQNNAGLVRAFLKRGVSVDKQDEDGNSLLHLALEHYAFDVYETLLSFNPNPNVRNKYGITPLFLLARNYGSYSDKVKDFFKLKNIDVEAQTTIMGRKMSPLHVAVLGDNFSMIEQLYIAGADFNVKDDCSLTPVCYAVNTDKVSNVDVRLLKHLIVGGADLNYETETGVTPAKLVATNAIHSGDYVMCMALLHLGVDPLTFVHKKLTFADFAYRTHNREFIECVESFMTQKNPQNAQTVSAPERSGFAFIGGKAKEYDPLIAQGYSVDPNVECGEQAVVSAPETETTEYEVSGYEYDNQAVVSVPETEEYEYDALGAEYEGFTETNAQMYAENYVVDQESSLSNEAEAHSTYATDYVEPVVYTGQFEGYGLSTPHVPVLVERDEADEIPLSSTNATPVEVESENTGAVFVATSSQNEWADQIIRDVFKTRQKS